MTSYFGVVRAADGHWLLGGTKNHVSSRFETQEDAQLWVDTVVETNKECHNVVAYALVHASPLPAEITHKELI